MSAARSHQTIIEPVAPLVQGCGRAAGHAVHVDRARRSVRAVPGHGRQPLARVVHGHRRSDRPRPWTGPSGTGRIVDRTPLSTGRRTLVTGRPNRMQPGAILPANAICRHIRRVLRAPHDAFSRSPVPYVVQPSTFCR